MPLPDMRITTKAAGTSNNVRQHVFFMCTLRVFCVRVRGYLHCKSQSVGISGVSILNIMHRIWCMSDQSGALMGRDFLIDECSDGRDHVRCRILPFFSEKSEIFSMRGFTDRWAWRVLFEVGMRIPFRWITAELRSFARRRVAVEFWHF